MEPKELHNRIQDESVLVVDVREPDEYKRGHIEDAVNIPLAAVDSGILAHLQAEQIVMQCNSGNRSTQACDAVAGTQTDKYVYNLSGGIAAWEDAGFTVVEEDESGFPLDRQVQIAAGAIILFGIILGFFVSTWLYLISAFVGAGLFNAGITGWCGMAKLLARAPWNKA